jgi:hypothetical protein
MDKQPIITAVVGAIGAIAIGGSIVMTQLGTVDVCTEKGCVALSKTEYAGMKTTLAEKYRDGIPMTIDEWKAFAAVLDMEIRRDWFAGGKMRIKEYRGDFPTDAYNFITK